MFNFLKTAAKKMYDSLTQKLSGLFAKQSCDESFFEELKTILLAADTGPKTTALIIEKLKTSIAGRSLDRHPTCALGTDESDMQKVKKALEEILISLLVTPANQNNPQILLLVGINGGGKTTFAAKYAHFLQKQGSKVMLVAADTFRAAAVSQLQTWGERIGVTVFCKPTNNDPAAVVFDACALAKEQQYDYVIIDTAGRLQTKVNLMKELEKVRKVIGKHFDESLVQSWLVIDAMIGQNSYEQAKVFHEATHLDGLIISKLDGTAKGGIVFSLSNEFNLPVRYVTHGEGIDDIAAFDRTTFVKNILEM